MVNVHSVRIYNDNVCLQNQVSLRNTVAQTETVRVLRSSGDYERISSDELVPGDVIELPRHRAIVACDAVLLTGTCVVNESMLTGEYMRINITCILCTEALLLSARYFRYLYSVPGNYIYVWCLYTHHIDAPRYNRV